MFMGRDFLLNIFWVGKKWACIKEESFNLICKFKIYSIIRDS